MRRERQAERIRRATEAAGRAGLDALVVSPSADLIYLLDYDPLPLERLTALVLRPDRDAVALVPALERPLAADAGVERLAELSSWGDTQDPYRMIAELVGPASRVGCSDQMWAAHLLRFQRVFKEARFFPASAVLAPLRAVKDSGELGLLKRAARYADEAFGRIIGTRLETRTEREVADTLGELLVELGHDRVAFTIVGSGPNAASPHHEPGSREIQAGDAVVLDFGGRTGGYCSDVSRTVAVSRTPDEFDRVYEVVREAQEAAFQAIRPGIPAQDVDRAARRVIEDAGFGELFIHRTGHGIGLEEHEPPYIVEGNEQPLRPGMCFSVEPGIYVPGRFGVRIEDIVTVTDSGAERLNRATRELEVVR